MAEKNYPTCGAKKKQAPYGPCTRPSGWGTDHPGQGRCKLHAGCSKPKHGLYSSIKRPRLQAIIKEIQDSGADPFDMVPEIELIRAHLRDYQDRCEGEPDVEVVSMLIDRTSKVIERAAKVRDNSPLTIESVSKSYEGMAHIVAKVCGDAGRHDLAEKIQELWLRLPVG